MSRRFGQYWSTPDKGTGVAAAYSDMRIIFQDRDYTRCRVSEPNSTFWITSRRDQLTKRFFRRNVLPATSCLHYLLSAITLSRTDCKHPRNFEILKSTYNC